jgi:hypothetical protein
MTFDVQKPHEVSALIDTQTRKLRAQLLGAMMRGEARLRPFGCDHVRDLRRALQLETLHLRLQHPVRIGDPLVLAEMLEPTIDQKRLDEA